MEKNNFHYYIKDTNNATLVDASPTDFNAGGHNLSQNTTSLDFSKYLEEELEGISLAFGLEFRSENFTIFSGEEASYTTYDINGEPFNKNTPISDIVILLDTNGKSYFRR